MIAAPKYIVHYLLKPVRFVQRYDTGNLKPDVLAGLSVAVVSLPQVIAFALIAELPPQMGIYAAVAGGIVGALWGSSNQTVTGPTSALSLLVLSSLMLTAVPGTPEFMVVAGLAAVMVGVLQLVMGLARLGVLVNFVSHSVIVGFTGGAGLLIAIRQLRRLLGLNFESQTLLDTSHGLLVHLRELNPLTTVLGILTMALIFLIYRMNRKLPGAVVGMVFTSLVVFVFSLNERGVDVIGKIPGEFPPLANLPLFDLDMFASLSSGALAIGAIGLVQTTAISRSLATQTGQRLDSNQEFVGQGLANIAAGFLSGYPCSASFSCSAMNFRAGARTALSAMVTGLGVLIGMYTVGPLTAYLPRAALAAVLIISGISMIDRREIVRICQGARGDALILGVTFLGTLFLHIEFAVLAGILLSFAVYIFNTSVPRVESVLPDEDFRHFLPQPKKSVCPQLGILEIHGDLYFGAVSHFEGAVDEHVKNHPEQRFLLLRMQSVNQCDFSGIHGLESIVRAYRERGGDVFLTRVQEAVFELMKSTGFYRQLGADHFLSEDVAVTYLFHKIIDPAICIYECPVRAFKECQNLPKREYPVEISLHTDIPDVAILTVSARQLWTELHRGLPPVIIDVREPREFHQGHIPQAVLVPLPKLLSASAAIPRDRPVVFVCRAGRRSTRAACVFWRRGYENVAVLEGGMRAWEQAGLLEAVDTGAVAVETRP